MAMKRCPDCGEKYSDSYKYCPFCEEEEILKEGKDRGRRRSRRSREFSLLTPVLILLILLMAGLLMFLLRGDKKPKEPVTPQPGVVTPQQPGGSTEDPGNAEEPSDNPNGGSEDPGVMPDEPGTTPTTPATPATPTDTAASGAATIVNAPNGVNVRPDPSTGNPPIASLKDGDSVTVVKDAGSGWYEISFSGHGGQDTHGYVKGEFLSTKAGSSTGADTSSGSGTTPSPSGNSGTTSSSSTLKAGKGKVVNAATGVRVRPDPSTNGTPLASLNNGDEVQIVKSAGNGWYEVTFTATGGKTATGYLKGEYLANS